MPLLNEPPCPHCGQQLPTRELWTLNIFDLNGRGLFNGKVGIICPKCDEKLKIIQTGVYLALILPAMGAGLIVGLFGGILKDVGIAPKFIIIVVTVPVCGFWLRYGPCFARAEYVKPLEEIYYPLSPPAWNDDEYSDH
jgi:hypothetical protein